jgi:hypothetical protein
MKLLEFSLKCLILTCAVVVAGYVVKREFVPRTVSPTSPTAGEKLKPQLDNGRRGLSKNVVLALQTTCHFCNESMPFYKLLLATANGRNIGFTAVFPQATAEATKHLSTYGISGISVLQADLEDINITGTPTLIIANESGTIERVWLGKLTPDQEIEVMHQLDL